MKVSFVIPVFNHFDLLNQLLVDIVNHTNPDEIIVVDDHSQDSETLDGLNWWGINLGIKVIRPIQNLGFLKASNYGMSKATGDILCLISSDVRIEDDLVQTVRNLLSGTPRMLIGGIVYWHDTGWNCFGNTLYPYCEGWLLSCTKEAWGEFGGFDERYAPHDYEDMDFSTTAISKGYSLYSLNNPRIKHLAAQTIGYSEQREEITKRNRERFREKWIKDKV